MDWRDETMEGSLSELASRQSPRDFPVEVVRVVDGDTFDFTADLGFGVSFKGRCRMARINAPELPTPEGLAAKAELERIVKLPEYVWSLFVHGQEKYGRWLADLHGVSAALAAVNVNDMMVKGGFAVYV